MTEGQISPENLLWLAGYLEGEGAFHHQSKGRRQPTISVDTTDPEIALRVARLLRTRAYGPYPRQGRPRRKPEYLIIAHHEGVPDLMRGLWPLMGSSRKRRITQVLAEWENGTQPKIKTRRAKEERPAE
jgi:hypothetical protein